MKTVDIDNFITDLTTDQKRYLLDKLKSLIIGGLPTDITLCPCCNSNNFMKYGTFKGVQKYKCRNTNKAFTYKTNTIISGISKMDKLAQLIEMMGSGRFPTITNIQEIIGVSRQTAFDWRTKILTAIYQKVDLDNQIIEFDEAYFRLSRKGRKGLRYSRRCGTSDKRTVDRRGDNPYNVKVFMAYSRNTKKLELYTSHMGMSRLNHLEAYLGSKKDLVVYSDGHSVYRQYYNKRKIVNATFRSSDHVSATDQLVHTQTINYFGGHIGNFLNDTLKGVSTKYIQGYMNWIMFVQNGVKQKVDVKEVIKENKVALDVFKQKEKEFEYFLRNNGRTNYGTYNDRYYRNIT